MRIWLVGGGTAGHALPLTALASELKSSGADVLIVTDRGQAAAASLAGSTWPVKRLFSGKFRRYHGRDWSSRLLDIGTLVKNLFDSLLIALSFIQSLWLVLSKRPDVVFINGGSIGVPIAWSANLFKRPYLIHESDTTPGLANRLIAPKAKRVLLGLASGEVPSDGRHFVTGIPLRANFYKAKKAGKTKARRKLKLTDKPVILVTGGSQGAAVINQLIMAIAHQLTEHAQVIHLCGAANLNALKSDPRRPKRGYRLVGFAGAEMADYIAAADVVVARAGASTLADLAFFAKPSILIPNPLLVGGHQLTNAQSFADAGAAVVLDEQAIAQHPQRLLGAIERLLADHGELKRLGAAIGALARPDAAADIARHILVVARGE